MVPVPALRTRAPKRQRRSSAGGASRGVVLYHHHLATDRRRVGAFAKALSRRVRPGDVVIDAGAGSGILGILALKAGASRVYAIERKPELRDLVRGMAEANGYGGRLVFVPGEFGRVRLPEKVDGLVTETMGPAGFDEGIHALMAHAWRRYLKPGAWVIPESVSLWVQLVELLPHNPLRTRSVCGVDLAPLTHRAARWPIACKAGKVRPLSGRFLVWGIDYRRPGARWPEQAEVTAIVSKEGECAGALLWFEACLSEGARLNSRRAGPSWKPLILPSLPPIPVRPGRRGIISIVWPRSSSMPEWGFRWFPAH